jgi:3-hydroxyacyl-CoA dehydrogenase
VTGPQATARTRARAAPAARATSAQGTLWAALADRVEPLLKKRGEKAKLGRELGVSGQQIYAYFNTRTVAPDAERTLRLIVWLAQTEARLAEEAAAKKP